MRKIFFALTALILIVGAALLVNARSARELDLLNTAISRTATYLQRNVPNPKVGSVGGEWTVLGLARSGRHVPDSFFLQYFKTVEAHVKERNGVLDERRFTEYSRVILALTAAGFDPRYVGGFDLLLPLGDFERTTWQGINGAIFALLALDSLDYEIPINENAETQSTRELFLQKILQAQTPDGGWALTGETGDPDITGMALQALAKYRGNPYAAAAIENALEFLSDIQNNSGGFSGGFSLGEDSLETAVQVLVALTELEIPIDDPRFVKNRNTILANILRFQNPNGSFRHGKNSLDENLMSTEIGFYGLVAAQRSLDDRNSLYRMGDRRVKSAVTLVVNAQILLESMDLLDREKHELVPSDGLIFPETAVPAFYGDTVFDVLNREMRNAGIHMVSRRMPVFDSVYVEGINNIFEFDAGPLSGWKYRVNGEFSSFGASSFIVQSGDFIEWIYTIDLGRDLEN